MVLSEQQPKKNGRAALVDFLSEVQPDVGWWYRIPKLNNQNTNYNSDAVMPHLGTLFPDDVALLCPETTITMIGNNIRNPILFLTACGGILIGFCFGLCFIQQQKSWARSAFVSFGMMNVTAIWLHCLLPAPRISHIDDNDSYYRVVLWSMDCYFTGVSSLLLCFGALQHHYKKRTKKKNHSNDSMIDVIGTMPVHNMIWVSHGLAIFAVISFLFCWSILLLLDSRTSKIAVMKIKTLSLELWYLLPTMGAAILYAPLLMSKFSSSLRRTSMLLAIMGFLLPVLGITLDATFCRSSSFWNKRFVVWDAFTAPTMVFLGCNVSFLAIADWLRKKDNKPKMKLK